MCDFVTHNSDALRSEAFILEQKQKLLSESQDVLRTLYNGKRKIPKSELETILPSKFQTSLRKTPRQNCGKSVRVVAVLLAFWPAIRLFLVGSELEIPSARN
jgi:hypothetical protein